MEKGYSLGNTQSMRLCRNAPLPFNDLSPWKSLAIFQRKYYDEANFRMVS